MPDYRHRNAAELAKRMREEPRRLILVTGPRQTGKTTAVLQALQEVGLPSRYVAVDQPAPSSFLALPDTVWSEAPPFGRRDEQWLFRVWEVTLGIVGRAMRAGSARTGKGGGQARSRPKSGG